jgi:SulP family sulfate permease
LIAGAAGAVAIPLAELVATHGTQYVGATVMMASLLETIVGVLKLGNVSKVITEPIMCGYLNAFAVFLALAQVFRAFRLHHSTEITVYNDWRIEKLLFDQRAQLTAIL